MNKMDSKNIYICCGAMLRKADWEKINKNEWSYIGTNNDFSESACANKIEKFFPEEILFLVMGRHDSQEIKREEAVGIIKDLIKNKNITLCDKDFQKFMVFSKIGVVKEGKINR